MICATIIGKNSPIVEAIEVYIMDNEEKKYKKMTEAPVNKLVCSMAVPSIISMLVTALYNLADTFFVGKLGTEATGAIGVVFPYMTLIQAIAFFFGHGSGNFISRALGARKREEAQKMAAVGFFSAVILGCIIGVGGLIFIEPLLTLFGATKTIMPEAKKYMIYILIATPFIMGAFVLNNIMRLQGNAKMGVIGIASGAVLNVALDPIMIWVMDMGTAGAGLATGLSQLISFGLLLFLSGRNGGLKISWKNFEVKWKNYKEIIAGGIPSLARQGLGSIASICLNNVAGIYGDPVIAGFSVVNRIMFVLISVLLGFGQGFQPVCGFNYGAGLYQRVKKAFWFCVKVSSVVMLVIAVVIFFNAEPLVRRFSKNDMELIEVGVKALRIQCVSLPLMGFIVLSNMCLQNTRKTVRATIVAMARQGVMLIPAIYILEGLLGLEGLILAQFAADIATFILSIPLMTTALKEMKIQK